MPESIYQENERILRNEDSYVSLIILKESVSYLLGGPLGCSNYFFYNGKFYYKTITYHNFMPEFYFK